MRSRFSAATALLAFSVSLPVFAQQSTETPVQRYDRIALLTQLNRKDAQPFHLKIDAQIYNIEGKPAETGTIEEWWASPDLYRIEITSGSLHQVTASGQASQGDQDTRTSYLLQHLLDETVHPLRQLFPGETVSVHPRNFGKVDLECLDVHSPPDPVLNAFAPTVCTEPGADALRAELFPMEMIARNSVGAFRGTDVALSTTIAYLGHEAVSGKITALQAFTPGDPGTPALQRSPVVAAAPDQSVIRVQGGVIAGHILTKISPEYPSYARRNHIGGTVLLHATITRQGKVRGLFVLASPHPVLSEAAMHAVRDWTYSPYLLNGQPTDVDTTITVNFNLNGSPFLP